MSAARTPTRPGARGQHGIVLPIVLVFIVLTTLVVLFGVRRASTEEQLANTVRGVVTLDTAAQYALRHCERWLWVSPPGLAPEAGMPDPPVTVAPATDNSATAPAMWERAAVVAAANVLPAAALAEQVGAQITDGRCVIEDASAELAVAANLPSGNLPSNPDWRKFRITAIVTGPSAGGNRTARAQSEVRMLIGGGP